MADLDVAVVPRASADRVGPWADGVLRVRVEPISGLRARRKRFRVDELDSDALEQRLRGLRPD